MVFTKALVSEIKYSFHFYIASDYFQVRMHCLKNQGENKAFKKIIILDDEKRVQMKSLRDVPDGDSFLLRMHRTYHYCYLTVKIYKHCDLKIKPPSSNSLLKLPTQDCVLQVN